MKKIIFTALVAVVAISGAFAGNLSQNFINNAEYKVSGVPDCIPGELKPNCNGSGSIRCQVISNNDAFQLNSNCIIELYRNTQNPL